MKIKGYKYHDYDYVFICTKDSVKDWIKEKGWTELHQFTSHGTSLRDGDFVPVEEVFKKIDDSEAVAVYTKSVHEGHQLSLMMGNTEIVYFYVLSITRDDIDEYTIPKPYCKRCKTIRGYGGGQSGCTPNWDDSQDMEWNLTNKKNEPYYPEHDWSGEYGKYE